MASLFSRLMARGQPPRGSEPPEQKRSAIGPLVAFHEVGRPIWTQRSGTALTEAGYRRNAIVYRCVRLISEAAASVAISVFEAEHEDAAHPVAALLARPNPREAGSQFLEAVYGHLLLNGNAYLECVALGGLVRELHALRPDRIRVVPGPDGWPEAYEYAVGAETYTFRQDAGPQPPILHLKLFDPLDDQYGMPPLAAGQSALDTHNVASGWNKALLDNSARPSGALVYAADGANMTDAQFDRLKEELEQAFQGPVNAGRPILLEGGLDWKPLSMSPKDMDFMEAKGMAAREIALAFGVPPLLLGLPGDNTYANYAEANRAFWRQSVLPLVNRTLGSLAHWLTPSFGEGFRLEPDLDRIEALSTERAALWQRVDAASFLSADEKRAAVGYGPAAAEVEPVGALANEAGVEEVTKLKARLYDLELRYARDQPRDYHGRWTNGGGGGAPNAQPVAASQTTPTSQPSRGMQVAFSGPSGTTMSDAGGFMLPSDSQPQTAQLRGNGADLKPQLVQFAGDERYRVDLDKEPAKDHIVNRHIGRTDEQLREDLKLYRIDTLPLSFITADLGTFNSRGDADYFINETLLANKDTVDKVMRGEIEDAFVVKRFGYPTGREAHRLEDDSATIIRPTYDVGVGITSDTRLKRGFELYTAYPRNARKDK